MFIYQRVYHSLSIFCCILCRIKCRHLQCVNVNVCTVWLQLIMHDQNWDLVKIDHGTDKEQFGMASLSKIHNFGKSPFLMGKLTIFWVIFHSYFDITRGYPMMFPYHHFLMGKLTINGSFTRGYHTNRLCIQTATFQASSGRVTATAAAGSHGLPTPARAAAGRVARWSRRGIWRCWPQWIWRIFFGRKWWCLHKMVISASESGDVDRKNLGFQQESVDL